MNTDNELCPRQKSLTTKRRWRVLKLHRDRPYLHLLGEEAKSEEAKQLDTQPNNQSESLLHIATRIAHLGGWSLEVATSRITWSDEVCAIHEVPPGTSPSLEEAFNYCLPEWRELIVQALYQCVQEGTPFDLELEILTANRNRRWVQCMGEAERDVTGRVTHVFGAFQELSERKQAGSKLLQMATTLTKTIESITDAFYTLDRNWCFTYMNKEAERLMVRNRSELLGRNLWVEYPTVLGSVVDVEFHRAAAEKVTVNFEYYFAPFKTWFDVRAMPTTEGIAVYFQDINDKHHAHEALKASEERFRRLFSSASAGMVLCTLDGRYVQVNPAYCAMVGYSEEELLKLPFTTVVHSDDRAKNKDLTQRLLAGEIDSFVMEKRYLRKDGGIAWARTSTACVMSAQGEAEYLIAIAQEITQQKIAEERLKERDSLLHIAGRVARLGGWTVARGDTHALWSDEICSIHEVPFGTSPTLEEAFNFCAPEWREIVGDAFERCMHDGISYDLEIEIITAKGNRRWVQAIGEAEQDATGHILRVYGALQDISEKKQTERELRQLATRLTNTFESISDAFVVFDHEWRFRYLNEAAERLFGRSRDELLGRNARSELKTTPGSAFEIGYAKAVRENVPVTFEAYYQPFDKWLDVHAFPSAEGLSVYYRDVTERHKAEEQLREQAALLDKAQDAIIVCDLNNRITYWNQSAEHLYGWKAESVRGQSVEALLYTDSTMHQKAYQQLITAGEWVGEVQQISCDGRTLLVEAHWTLVRDDQGLPRSILAINTDISERKRLEAQLFRAQRMESIGTLASGIAHDLNNVLAPILLAVGLLKRQPRTPSEIKTLQLLENSAQHGADLVRQVLAFARGVEGQRQTVDLRLIVQDVAHMIRDTFDPKVRLLVEMPRDLWAIGGDPTEIHQILLNLCVNARDAMPNGGQLHLSAANVTLDEQYSSMHGEAKSGPYVMVKVADTGTGIPPEIRDRIFDPFFTTKEVGKGTGLGLATVLSVVKSHGGFINLYSEERLGTAFTIYIPALECEQVEDAPNADARLPSGHGEVVLVIDDEEAVRSVTKQTLEAFGYNVLLAEDGIEALAIYVQKRDEIAVVLTDMTMPAMDGITTIQTLRKINGHVKVIAASGLATQEMVAKAMSVGVKHFIPKPYSAETMLKTLAEILGNAN